MSELIFIVKHRDEINEWFKTRGIFDEVLFDTDEEGMVWYESFVSNYVASNAHRFSSRKLEHVWFELNLGDTRTLKGVTGRLKPDLLLQFEDCVWIVEVKYSQKAPQSGMSIIEDYNVEVEDYERDLIRLMESGWFPGKILKKALFCAYWDKDPEPSEFLKWPEELEEE